MHDTSHFDVMDTRWKFRVVADNPVVARQVRGPVVMVRQRAVGPGESEPSTPRETPRRRRPAGAGQVLAGRWPPGKRTILCRGATVGQSRQ